MTLEQLELSNFKEYRKRMLNRFVKGDIQLNTPRNQMPIIRQWFELLDQQMAALRAKLLAKR